MFIDARTIPDHETIETDICIIGAGAAGIALAREFAGYPMKISLVEGGDFEVIAETQDLFHGENIGLPYFPLSIARLRCFGGTTNHWGGTCRPFEEKDFAARSWIPYSGWPIHRTELQPFYARAETICGLRSAEWDIDYWLQRDMFSALPLLGDRIVTRIAQIAQSAHRRFAENYRREIEQASNVITYLNANITELETNESGNTVTGARVACLSGNRFVIRAKIFVLAAGGIENARLLLLSNRRHPSGLGNGHDQVGRYFAEHPRLRSGILLPVDMRTPLGLYELHYVQGIMIKGYMAFSEETLRNEEMVDVQIDLDPVYDHSFVDALASEEVVSLQALLKTLRGEQSPDDFRQHLSNVLADVMNWRDHVLATAPLPLPKPEVIDQIWQTDREERVNFISEIVGNIALAVYAKGYGAVPLNYVNVTTRVEQAPNPESRVTLTTERDQLGQNRVQLDWQLSPIDKYSVIRALEILGAEVGRAGVGRLQMDISEDEPGWPEGLHGGWHHMGATRMSEDPRLGVVDKNCQMHGVSNLFIAGSSVFPTAGSGTPTLTLVALALRLADYLKARMQ